MSARNANRLGIIVLCSLTRTLCVILLVAASPPPASLQAAQAVIYDQDG